MAKILALDSGTTSVRAMVFDERGRELGMCRAGNSASLSSHRMGGGGSHGDLG